MMYSMLNHRIIYLGRGCTVALLLMQFSMSCTAYTLCGEFLLRGGGRCPICQKYLLHNDNVMNI